MLSAVDGRVDAVVAAMAGGDIANMLMNTSYGRVTRSISSLLDEYELSSDELQERFARKIDTDPLALAPYVDPRDVLLVLARSDVIVPFEAQEALREALGAPEALYLPTGHRTSVFYFPLLRSRAYEFFERTFEAAQRSPGGSRDLATSAAAAGCPDRVGDGVLSPKRTAMVCGKP